MSGQEADSASSDPDPTEVIPPEELPQPPEEPDDPGQPGEGDTAEIGCGLERAAQLRHDIPDIRALWDGDLRVLRQF